MLLIIIVVFYSVWISFVKNILSSGLFRDTKAIKRNSK